MIGYEDFSVLVAVHLLVYGTGVGLGYYLRGSLQRHQAAAPREVKQPAAPAPIAVAILRPLMTPTPIPTQEFFVDRAPKVLCVHGFTPDGGRLAISVIAENNADLARAYERVNGQLTLYPVGGPA